MKILLSQSAIVAKGPERVDVTVQIIDDDKIPEIKCKHNPETTSVEEGDLLSDPAL
jgi:hypothetical protein